MRKPVLIEAQGLISKDRQVQYGAPEDNFGRWSSLCQSIGLDLSPSDLAMVMVLGKIARNANKSKRDNITDAAGYLGLYAQLEKL